MIFPAILVVFLSAFAGLIMAAAHQHFVARHETGGCAPGTPPGDAPPRTRRRPLHSAARASRKHNRAPIFTRLNPGIVRPA